MYFINVVSYLIYKTLLTQYFLLTTLFDTSYAYLQHIFWNILFVEFRWIYLIYKYITEVCFFFKIIFFNISTVILFLDFYTNYFNNYFLKWKFFVCKCSHADYFFLLQIYLLNFVLKFFNEIKNDGNQVKNLSL